jgi:ribosomal protein S2
MFTKFTISQFLFSNFHIGHAAGLRDRKCNLYLVFSRDNVDVINTVFNIPLLRKVVFIITNLSYRRKKILFVSENAAILSFFVTNINPNTTIDHPYVSIHWRPGILSNFKMTSKIRRKIMSRRLSARSHYSNFLRIKKTINYFSGILKMFRLPDFVFFCTAYANPLAILEAKTLRIPTSGVVDSNGSPYSVSYPIFGNDDSFYALTFLLDSIFRTLEFGNSHRILYFLQRTLLNLSSLFRDKSFLVKFSRIVKSVFVYKKNKKNMSIRGFKYTSFKRLKRIGVVLHLFMYMFKDISEGHRRPVKFSEILRVFRFFVKYQQIRSILVSNLLSKIYTNEKESFKFFYYLLFKIDSKSRNVKAK